MCQSILILCTFATEILFASLLVFGIFLLLQYEFEKILYVLQNEYCKRKYERPDKFKDFKETQY